VPFDLSLSLSLAYEKTAVCRELDKRLYPVLHLQ